MKFEQALKAMRRGEKVRRKRWPPKTVVRVLDGNVVLESCFRLGATGAPLYPWDNKLLANDWVIVRKKPKAPKPQAPLRDVFKDPQAGDVVARADDQRFQWIVVGVDSDSVTYWSVKGGGKLKESRSMWASIPEQYVVLHRVGEEVGSPDATV